MSDAKDVLNGHALKTVKVLGVLGGFAGAAVGAFLWLSGRVDAQASAAVSPVQVQVQDHEARLRSVERTQEEIRAGVTWIREEMERKRRR